MNFTAQEQEIIKNFLASKKILVADANASSRAGLARTLVQHGAVTQQVILASSYEVAENEIEKHKPDIVVCDYVLERKCGLDLLQSQRLHNQNTKHSIFVLVTGDTSQSSVARAAEEDIDCYILKPYTIDGFVDLLMRAILTKIKPSDYLKVIEKGKALLTSGKLDEAIEQFQLARPMDPTPSLACFYEGQANLIKRALDTAEYKYLDGLNYNRLHYKCMVGLYEVLMTVQKYEAAYEVVKRIAKFFPANPQRLTAVLRLAIQTKNYSDINNYYEIFTNIDERNELMVKYIGAALVVCGKFFLNSLKDPARALEMFQKAAVSAVGQLGIMREIVVTLLDHKMIPEAQRFVKRMPPENAITKEVLALFPK